MLLDQFATQIEPQPGSPDSVRLRIARPRKAPEHLRLVVWRNADALVSDEEERLVRLMLSANGHLDSSPLWTVLDGIADKVAEDLLHAPGVGVNHEMRKRCHEREGVPLCRQLPPRQHAAGQRHQIGRFAL